jgi:hypothetical protein
MGRALWDYLSGSVGSARTRRRYSRPYQFMLSETPTVRGSLYTAAM